MTPLEVPWPERERDSLARSLLDGPIVVAARPGALAPALIAEATSPMQPLHVDAAAAGNQRGLIVDTTRASVRLVAPTSVLTQNVGATDPDDLLALTRNWGRRVAQAIDVAIGAPPIDFSFDQALRGVPPDAVVIVDAAHLLTQRWAGEALWTLRGHVGDGNFLLALLAPTWAVDELLDEDAAFYGFARRTEITNHADEPAWTALLEREWPLPDIGWTVQRTEGVFAAMVEVVEEARRQRCGLREGLERVVAGRRLALPSTLRLAQALTALGGRLLRTIGEGDRPYPAVPGVGPNQVASSLNILQRAGLVYSPGRAEWRLSDPLLAEAFKSLRR